MKISTTSSSVIENSADAIVVAVWEGKTLTPAAAEVDVALGGVLSRVLAEEEFSGAHASTMVFYPPTRESGIAAKCVVLVGLGCGESPQGSSDLSLARISREAAGAATKRLATKSRETVAFYVPFPAVPEGIAGAMVGCTGQDLYRSDKKLFPIRELQFSGASAEELSQGQALGEATNWTRLQVNTPPADMDPVAFTQAVRRGFDGLPVEIEVWGEERLEQERCHGLLAVGRASVKESQLLIIHYRGGAAKDPVMGWVGKGVTFDSGGLSLKPSEAMVDMKCDMAGAATVVGAIKAVAAMGLPVNVSVYCGLVENMVSGDSYKLGDVLRTRAGITVEVHNTDAEGRIVLADVLDVAREQGVSCLVDLATLTGACMVALGRHVSGVFSNSRGWSSAVRNAAAEAGDWAWELPMFKLYDELISSPVADIKNVGDGRWGGAITAAKFLERFVGETPWVHVDIAGPSFSERPQSWIDAGASGCFVPSLVRLAARFSQQDLA
jgi:leucyl aminopeptidase